jgi:hypothetical protein
MGAAQETVWKSLIIMKEVIFFLVLVIFIFLISGCAITTPEITSQPNTIVEKSVENKSVQPVEKPVVKELNCSDWARSLFPEQWVFQQDVTHNPVISGEVLSLRQGRWRDGSAIRGTSSTKIQPGSEKGENIHYYYTRPIFIAMEQDKYGYSYSEKVIDAQGNLLGENSFKIRPVFKVLFDTVKEEKDAYNNTISMRYLSLLIAEPNLLSCEKIK